MKIKKDNTSKKDNDKSEHCEKYNINKNIANRTQIETTILFQQKAIKK